MFELDSVASKATKTIDPTFNWRGVVFSGLTGSFVLWEVISSIIGFQNELFKPAVFSCISGMLLMLGLLMLNFQGVMKTTDLEWIPCVMLSLSVGFSSYAKFASVRECAISGREPWGFLLLYPILQTICIPQMMSPFSTVASWAISLAFALCVVATPCDDAASIVSIVVSYVLNAIILVLLFKDHHQHFQFYNPRTMDESTINSRSFLDADAETRRKMRRKKAGGNSFSFSFADDDYTEEADSIEWRYLVANLSHDLKTPLAALVSGIESLQTMIVTSSSGSQSSQSPSNARVVSPHLPHLAAAPPLSTVKSSNSSDVPQTAQARQQQQMPAVVEVDALREIVASMHSTSYLMTMMIHRTIDYTKVSHDLPLLPSLQTIQISEILAACRRHVQPLLPTDISVYFDTDRSTAYEDDEDEEHRDDRRRDCDVKLPLAIYTDPQWLQESLTSLVVNAIKYSSQGGHNYNNNSINNGDKTNVVRDVQVKCSWMEHPETSASLLKISVADRGIGLAVLHTAESVFQRDPKLYKQYHQQHQHMPTYCAPAHLAAGGKGKARGGGEGGAGLGLFVLAQRMSALGGVCGYQPRRGGGSIFWFAIPYQQLQINVSHDDDDSDYRSRLAQIEGAYTNLSKGSYVGKPLDGAQNKDIRTSVQAKDSEIEQNVDKDGDNERSINSKVSEERAPLESKGSNAVVVAPRRRVVVDEVEGEVTDEEGEEMVSPPYYPVSPSADRHRSHNSFSHTFNHSTSNKSLRPTPLIIHQHKTKLLSSSSSSPPSHASSYTPSSSSVTTAFIGCSPLSVTTNTPHHHPYPKQQHPQTQHPRHHHDLNMDVTHDATRGNGHINHCPTASGVSALDRSLRILVVDDSLVILALLRRTLESAGHHVCVAVNGQQAVDLLFNSQIKEKDKEKEPEKDQQVQRTQPQCQPQPQQRSPQQRPQQPQRPQSQRLQALRLQQILKEEEAKDAAVVPELGATTDADTFSNASANTCVNSSSNVGPVSNVGHFASSDVRQNTGTSANTSANDITTAATSSVSIVEDASALGSGAVDAFDLVLMDIQMPVLDGIEATKRIRQRELQRCQLKHQLVHSAACSESTTTHNDVNPTSGDSRNNDSVQNSVQTRLDVHQAREPLQTIAVTPASASSTNAISSFKGSNPADTTVPSTASSTSSPSSSSRTLLSSWYYRGTQNPQSSRRVVPMNESSSSVDPSVPTPTSFQSNHQQDEPHDSLNDPQRSDQTHISQDNTTVGSAGLDGDHRFSQSPCHHACNCSTANVSSAQSRSGVIIIGCSANSDAEMQQDALKAGMDAYLSKPVHIGQLIETLQRLWLERGVAHG